MAKIVKIDFVSDISCPWCAIGLSALSAALTQVQAEVEAKVHVQPFELNPQMPPGGQDIGEHLAQKYGSTPEQQAQIRATIGQRGADVGFSFNPDGRGRIYNTFDAHRLLHWAGLTDASNSVSKSFVSRREAAGSASARPGEATTTRVIWKWNKQLALKQALLAVCHTERQAMDSHEVLLAAVAKVGLDVAQAQAVLASDAFAAEVRAAQAHYHDLGIHSVPAVIINDRHLISGGQPVAVFAQALRQIAAAPDLQ
jgi:predicted DsbA family dithiol-disulfide isomerase